MFWYKLEFNEFNSTKCTTYNPLNVFAACLKVIQTPCPAQGGYTVDAVVVAAVDEPAATVVSVPSALATICKLVELVCNFAAAGTGQATMKLQRS